MILPKNQKPGLQKGKKMNSISIFADSEFDGVRIDKYLSVVFPDLSSYFIKNTIDCGNVSVKGKTLAKNYKLKTD